MLSLPPLQSPHERKSVMQCIVYLAANEFKVKRVFHELFYHCSTNMYIFSLDWIMFKCKGKKGKDVILCWCVFNYFIRGIQTQSIKKGAALFAHTVKDTLRLWNSLTLFELAHSLLLYLGPGGDAVWWWRCLGSVWLIALFGWGFPYHNWEEKPFSSGTWQSAFVEQNQLCRSHKCSLIPPDCAAVRQHHISFCFFNQVITVKEIVVLLLSSP